MTAFLKELKVRWLALAGVGREEFQFTRGLVTRGKLVAQGAAAPGRKVAADRKVVAYRQVPVRGKVVAPAGSASAQILNFPVSLG